MQRSVSDERRLDKNYLQREGEIDDHGVLSR